MKKLLFGCFLSLLFSIIIKANGVGIVDAQTGIYLKLLSSSVDVQVENQVAVVTSTQIFKNTFSTAKSIKYVFPLPEGASVTGLDYKVDGIWHSAVFAATPQDTSLPGPGVYISPTLQAFIGKSPLFFDIEQKVKADSQLTIRVKYVELLKYENGKVNFKYPNNYSLIQSTALNKQELHFSLISQRKIDTFDFRSHTAQSISNDGHLAVINYTAESMVASRNYDISYYLSLNDLGLSGMSNFLPSGSLPDQNGNGFFLFIAEPNFSSSIDIINKVFTLIIDCSGSMGVDNKMNQAKNAASYIINNLNEGDKFNIIDFASEVKSFRNEHVNYTETNKSAALNYISNLQSNSLTNISGAFGLAIPQFSGTSPNTANIIIFLTDGVPTSGIQETPEILKYVKQLVDQTDTTITIFNFGIGNDVNKQLLTQLAAQNDGAAEFLANNQLEEKITAFYRMIRNPVLLNTSVVYSPSIVKEIYPNPLPNLYKGQQMIVCGRYSEPANLNIELNGNAFGKKMTYNYKLDLVDSAIVKNQFLTKIWAKLKIENLLVQYYMLDSTTITAKNLKKQIIAISVGYGVLSPFTSLTTDDNPSYVESDETADKTEIVSEFKLLGNYPNPFNPGTKIMFRIGNNHASYAVVKIYNTLGELIRTIVVALNQNGNYEVYWDGKLENGVIANSGVYIYTVTVGNSVLAGKMNLLK